MVESTSTQLVALGRRRLRIGFVLTLVMMAIYFGFVLLVAFDKTLMGGVIAPGLSLGMLLGALVIVAAWILTFAYVRWANTRYDADVAAITGARS